MSDIIRVNVGCGTTIAPGWINFDSSYNLWLSKHRFIKKVLHKVGLLSERAYKTNWPPGIIRRDVRKGLGLDDNSVDYIYTSAFLGYIRKEEAEKVLKECYRVLKDGGWIRISVLDLRKVAFKYVQKDLNFFGITTEDFLSDAFLEKIRYRQKEGFVRRLFYSTQSRKWVYDFNSLRRLLKDCGFSSIEKRRFKEGLVPDIDVLDGYEKDGLYVEAQKRKSRLIKLE